MLKTYFSSYSKWYAVFRNIDFLLEILSKIVVKNLDNGIKPESNLNTADKRVAEPS